MAETPVAIDLDALRAWMGECGIEPRGSLSAARVGRGHSNLTYVVRDEGSGSWVARRPPLGRLLPSAHDVVREARIMAALGGEDVPVPRIFGVSEAGRLADVPVVLMENVAGTVIDTLETAGSLPEAVRRSTGLSMARTLAAIHDVDIDAVGLGGLASRAPYAERQLKRWSKQWEASRTRELPRLDRLTALLASRIPPQPATTLVHGDFHVRNVIVDPASGEVRAAIDWELSTLGDPVADIGSTLAYWPEAGEDSHGMFAGSALDGFPRRSELAEAYLAASGRDGSSLGFWHVLGVWKIAIIAEGVLRRVLEQPANATEGEFPDAERIGAMVDHAWEIADSYGLA